MHSAVYRTRTKVHRRCPDLFGFINCGLLSVVCSDLLFRLINCGLFLSGYYTPLGGLISFLLSSALHSYQLFARISCLHLSVRPYQLFALICWSLSSAVRSNELLDLISCVKQKSLKFYSPTCKPSKY